MSDSQNNDATEVLEFVADNVKRLRSERHLTQQQLAEKSDVSRRMIASLENGQANISLAKLNQIAMVLGVSFTEIVRPHQHSHGQPSQILTWKGSKAGSEAYLGCSVVSQNEVELWDWKLAAGDMYPAEPDPAGFFEMIYVIDGVLRLELEDKTHVLHPGQSISFPSDQHYRYVNRQGTPTRFIRNAVVLRDEHRNRS